MKNKLLLCFILTLFWLNNLAYAQLPGQLPGLNAAIPGDDSIGLAAGDQNNPAISTGNGSQLVVWTDDRANPYTFYEYETSNDIYGIRLDANGQPLDTVPFAISDSRGSQTAPKAAWNARANAWLVVFNTLGLSGTGFYYQSALAAVRVAADGTVLDADPVPLFGLSPGQWTVASDGVNWVVAAQGGNATGDIVAARIGPDGSLLDLPSQPLVDEAYFNGSSARLVYASGVFLLTFNGSTGTFAQRFDTTLNPLDGAPFELLNGHYIADVASSGSGFYIVWNQQRPDFSTAVMGTRVDTSGVKLDGTGDEISGNFPVQGINSTISAAWDGSNWAITWMNSNTLRIARVSATGTVLQPGGVAVSGPVAGPTAGTGAGGVQVVWSEFNNNEYDVFGATINANNMVAANSGLSTGQPRQNRADLTAGASGYMLVYRSAVAGQVRVLAQPLNASGAASTAAPIELDSGATLSGPGSPAVAWNGSVYLVSWGNSNGIVAIRIDQNGNTLDTAPTLLMTPGFGATDVAAVGSDFLVVGRRFGFTIQTIFTIGTRVSGVDGSVIDSSPILLGSSSQSPFTVYARAPKVTAVGDRWLAAWHTNFTHDDPLAQTVGVFVNSDGTRDNPFLIHNTFSTSGGNGIFELGLASDGVAALLVQSQELSSGVETDLLARIINSDGSVQPMVNLTPWAGNQYRPSISFDGTDYMVVFQDQKNRLAAHTLDQLDARSDLYGMRIDRTGAVIDRQGFLIDDSPLGETDLTIASRGSDTLIAASQMLNDGMASAYRIFLSDVIDGTDRFPVAMANASVREGDAPLSVVFDSTGSYDPEGTALSYLWDFADGTTSTLSNPVHVFTQPGEYPVVLTVMDAAGQTSAQAIMINASKINELPVAVASVSRVSGPVPLNVTLFAEGSYDPDGALGNTEWRRSNGSLISYNQTAFATFSSEGTYTVTLRVFDSRGAIGEDTLTIEALPASVNQPPTAAASATPTSGDAPLSVAFSSSGSSDADGSIVSYAWDFGDGTSGSGANPSHVYTSVGEYIATLTVTDNSGASVESDPITITVNALSGAALLTDIAMSTLSRRGVATVNGIVTVTNGLGGVEQSAIVQGRWTLPDGSTVSRFEYSDRKGKATFSVSASMDGRYTLDIITVTKSGFLYDPNSSEISDSITLGGSDTIPPAQPNGLSATADNAQITLDWADNSETDLAGYHVYRAGAETGPFSRLTNSPVAASQYTDSGLVNGDTYYYQVSAVDTSGNESTRSSTTSATPQGGATGDPVSLHVSSIVLSTVNMGKGAKSGQALVSVVDNNGTPVGGATVTGSFSGSYNEAASGTTAANGSITLQTTEAMKGGVSFGFCVTDVSYSGLSYDNAENCSQF